MNRFLAIGALIVAIFAITYFFKKENVPANEIDKPESALISSTEPTSTNPVTQTTKEIVISSSAASQSVTSQSSTSSTGNASPLGTGQPQNAVDFNAPGAGTAQQKASAAAAANKAYQESRQQIR